MSATEHPNRQLPSWKDLLVIVPAASSAIAVTYDVGFFSGIGLSYFTTFSFTEHLVFALQALPLAFVFVVGFSFAFIVSKTVPNPFHWLYKLAKSDVEPALDETDNDSKIKSYEARLAWLNRREKILRIATTVFALFNMGLATYYAKDKDWLLFTLHMLICVWVGAFAFAPSSINIDTVSAALVPLSLLTISFSVGFQIAQSAMNSTKQPYTLHLQNEEVRGSLIRSGERGVLFLDSKTREVSLYRWDNVKRIAYNPSSSHRSTN